MTDNIENAQIANSDFTGAVPSVLTQNVSDTPLVTEDMLSRRYGRFTRKKEDLVFEFTRDPALIHQYYRIYEEEFKAVLHADYHHSADDVHDQKGYFLIVRQGKLCVGGARLNIKTPRQPHLLPIEMDGFRIEDYFPHLGQKQLRYGQIGRLCVLPEFRGGQITLMMMRHLYRKSSALGLSMLFATAPLVLARSYMKISVSMGLKETKMHSDIVLPPYPMCEEIKFYLISVGMEKSDFGDELQSEDKISESEEI